MKKSREIRLENIDDEDRRMIFEVLDEAHLVAGKKDFEKGLTKKDKHNSEIIDSLEALDDDDLAAITAAENEGLQNHTLIEPDPVGGIDAYPIDFAAHDAPSKFEELPMDFNGIEDSSDAISEQSNNQLETIIQSLIDIW